MRTLLLLLFATGAFAQDSAQWGRVQALRKGDRVGVIRGDKKRVEGRFESATDARITLRADQEISIEKSDVIRVYRPARHGRVFGAVLGGAIGTAAGAVADGTLGQYLRNESNGPDRGLITLAGAGAGAGIGAAASGGYRTIYQRAK